MADDKKQSDYNPWHPMSKPIDLKHLGKLAEECGELSAAIARCIIQGIDEKEPVTGKVNKEWLEDEIADVMANIFLVERHFGLNSERMMKRGAAKAKKLITWHKMV